MASLLDTVEDPGADNFSKYDVLVYGASGSGKTSLLSTCRGNGLVLYTPTKEGYGGVRILSRWRKRIKFKAIRNFDDYYKWYVALRDDNAKRPPDKRFNWVAFDTVTGALQLLIQKVLGMRPKQVHGKVKITGDEWGRIAGYVDTDLVLPYMSLPISTIWLAQERYRKRRSKTITEPDVTPGALRAIMPATDFTGRLYVVQNKGGERETRMRIGRLDTVQVKYRTMDRRLEVPQVLLDPHIEDLVDYLYSPSGTKCPFEEVFEPLDEETEEEDAGEEVEPGGKKGAKGDLDDADDDDDGDDDDE